MPAISPHRFQTLLWGDERLNDTRRLILLRVAFAAVGSKDRHGWVEISHATIGRDIGRSRETVSRNMQWCLENGYLGKQQPVVNGRFLTAQYRLSDAGFRVTPDDSPCDAIPSHGRVTPGVTETVTPASQRLRSNQTGADDDAAPRGGGGSNGNGQPPTAEAASAPAPAPALEARAGTGAEHVQENPARRSALTRALWQRGLTREEYGHLPADQQQQLEDELLNDWQAQHRDRASGVESESVVEPPMHVPPARLTNPLHHRCPDCHAPIGRRCHRPMGYCPARRRLAETAALQPA